MLALIFVAILTGCGTVPAQEAGRPFDRLHDIKRTVPSASANLGVAPGVARIEGALDPATRRGKG